MKDYHYFILVSALLLAGLSAHAEQEASASSHNVFEKEALETPSIDNDIIYEVQGESKTFVAHYTSTSVNYFGIEFQEQICPLEVVFSGEDDVYLKNFITSTTFNTYIKGKKPTTALSSLSRKK